MHRPISVYRIWEQTPKLEANQASSPILGAETFLIKNSTIEQRTKSNKLIFGFA